MDLAVGGSMLNVLVGGSLLYRSLQVCVLGGSLGGILTVMLKGISKAVMVLSALMKMYANPCHDRGHINVMLVLQSSSDPLHIIPGASSETNATSGSVCNFSNLEVEDDIGVIEGVFLSINEEVDIDIKQEEIPEPVEVSYICKCLLFDTLYQCP